LVGHLPALRRDRLAFFAGLGNDSGAAVRCRLPTSAYLLNDPEDIRHVLVRNARNYVKGRRLAGPRARYPSKARSLLTSSGAEHRRRRRAIQRSFRGPLVDAIVGASRANAERMTAGWSDGAEINVAGGMRSLAQRNILEALLGSPADGELDDLRAATRARQRFFEQVFTSLLPLREYLPTSATRAHLAATRRLDGAIHTAIDARRRSTRRPGDMLSMLMDARYEDGSTMSDDEVRDEVRTLTLTGYDSVSEALSWSFYLLAKHPEVDAALADEARSGAEASSPIELPRATRIVRESLRLYPPTWVFVRIARREDALPSGATIRAGAKVYVSPYVVHHNPRYWPEPERFAPERFDDGAEEGRPRYAYLPFGGGPHVCIGEAFAMAQIVTVLATVAKRHRLTLSPGQDVVPEPRLTLRPKDGLRMLVEARDRPARPAQGVG
jgi:cytochrome P450